MFNRRAHFLTRKNIFFAIFISVFYLLLSAWLVGFKTDQVFLVVLVNAMYFIADSTRKLITGFFIFVAYWILFDYMKAFPNYRYNRVHIQDLYEAEKSLFGFAFHGKIVTANEYWLINHQASLDILAGCCYLCWIPLPLAFAAYLFFTDKEYFLHFSFSFVWVNLLGFVIYYLFPAAPPWYLQEHGFAFIPGTSGNTAGLARFDDFFHLSLFKNIYAKSSNVFAAMPSLHAAYPLIVLYYGLKKQLGLVNVFFGLIIVGVWFAAVYTSHHYILDVLAGIICAFTGIFTYQKGWRSNKRFVIFFNQYLQWMQ